MIKGCRAVSWLFVGLLWANLSYAAPNAEPIENAPLPFSDLRSLTEAFGRVKSEYVEPVEDTLLLKGAIRGMMEVLDPHSIYLDPDEYRELQIGASGEFGGVGIELGMEDGFPKVISPIDGTPAQRAGIQTGDMIIRIDDTSVKGMSLAEAAAIMRGPPGSEVTLTILREREEKPIRVTLSRDIIQIKSVRSKLLDSHYAYIRVTQFQSHTAKNLKEAIFSLSMASKNSLKGLVLDLRNNPGGILQGAVGVSDQFLNSGMIVSTRGRYAETQMNFEATANQLLAGVPIVVLVNAGSASASEIVAGALQDHRRAVIMGEKTFGKGSVQSVTPLYNGGAIKMTTARYYTPLGRSIQAEGIVPDIEVDLFQQASRVVKPSQSVKRLKEADLRGHLTNGEKEKEEKKKSASSPSLDSEAVAADTLESNDFLLTEALNLLKGLAILKAP